MNNYILIMLGFIFVGLSYASFHSILLRDTMPYVTERLWYSAGIVAMTLFCVFEIWGFSLLPI
jgi:hypothetical protein